MDNSNVEAEIAAGLGLSLSDAARRLPSARQGRPVHSSCVWRWITSGVRLANGAVVRLEAARLAGRYLTSTPALERFLARQTLGRASEPARLRTAVQRQRASERAQRELQKLGI
ncbi:MAG TPA: hypothetical protein VE999_09180 [Gemmataceae bacterium]|nr:hypothetical protein [Gemmataceae bacterium]